MIKGQSPGGDVLSGTGCGTGRAGSRAAGHVKKEERLSKETCTVQAQESQSKGRLGVLIKQQIR